MEKTDSELKRIKEIQKIELEILMEMDRICREKNLTYCLAYGSVLGAVRHKGFIPWDYDIDIMVTIDQYDEFCEVLGKELPQKYCVYSVKTDDTYEEMHARVGLRDESHLLKHIDIFPMVGAPEKGLKRKVFSKMAYISHRCHLIKKVNVDINYKDRPQRRVQANLLKVVLFPFHSKIFVRIFHHLSRLHPIDKADTVYSICGFDSEIDFIPLDYLDRPEYLEFEGVYLPVPRKWDEYLTKLYGDYTIPKQTDYYNK